MPGAHTKILWTEPVQASAPCRVDAGGTWDIKSLSLPLEHIKPLTINIAINLRTRVFLRPFKSGRVKISSAGFSEEEHPFTRLPFDSPFGLFYAAVSYFNIGGLDIHIAADAPVKSSLGGSSTALIALIKALAKLRAAQPGKGRLSRHELLHLGYHLEDAVSAGKCGVQDQAAAVFGGVHSWQWCYGKSRFLKRTPLLDHQGQEALSQCLLVAFSGKSHVSSRINQGWLKDFMSGKTRAGWIKANETVHRLEPAIRQQDWKTAARYLREEMSVRREITPNALIPLTARLIDQAEALGCGARFAGAGAGGSVWALGEPEKIETLRKLWQKALAPIQGAGILDCRVDAKGVS